MDNLLGFVIMNDDMMKTLNKAKAFSAENGISLHEALMVMQISLIGNLHYLVDNVDTNIDKQARN